MSLIQLSGVTRTYGQGTSRTSALAGVDLAIEEGQMVALTGASGSGKSTLLQILGCLDRPTTGTYTFEGADVGALDRTLQARFRNTFIGFVFQAFHLLEDANALENVELPLVYAGVPELERVTRSLDALASVGIEHLAERRPNQMSGGQRQRVAIARALVTRPSLILADEPTGNLDSRSTEDVLQLLREIHAQGKTIVVVTHDEEVAQIASRRIVVHDGLIEEVS
jgi:putative ABC transport system ATP-binding protein